MAGWCSDCNFSLWCFSWPLLHCYFRMLPSQDQLLKIGLSQTYSQPLVFILKSDHNYHAHGKLKSLLWMYQTNSTDSTRHQSSKLGLWSQVFKAKQLVRKFTDLLCVLIIVCLPQTVQVAICRLVCLPDTGWSGGKTELFPAMLSWQHRWADLQWLSIIGSLLLTPNSFPLNV